MFIICNANHYDAVTNLRALQITIARVESQCVIIFTVRY
jgi:hypothetical protein